MGEDGFDAQTRLAAVLRELKELGVGELFLDGLSAAEAVALVGARHSGREGGPGPGAMQGAATRPVPSRRGAAPARAPTPPGAFPGPPEVAPAPAGQTVAPEAGGPLQVLAAEAAGCTKCRLAEGRTQVVFGRGSPTADLVVVGEAPGGEEDRQGLPFVGPAGKLLDLMLLSVGFPRDRVYICNVLKCRPPQNRDPQADEVASCSPWLHRQLDLIQPKVLLAVGKFAGQMLSGSDASISRLRGVVHSYRGIPVVATYHPAYLLRSPHATRGTWQDFQLMRRVLDEHD